MALNPWAAIHKATSLLKGNQTSKLSDSLKMLPDGTIPGGTPVATDHTHGNKSQGDPSQAKYDASRKNDSITFMGKEQVDAFSNLTAPESVGRDGNVIAAADTPKPLTGQAPVLGTDYDRITPRPEEEATMGSYAGYKTT